MARAATFRVLVFCLISCPAIAQVGSDRLLRANDEPHNWLTYSGTYFSQRHSLLGQIDASNVANIELKWVYHAETLPSVSRTPRVGHDLLYVQPPPYHILDVA